VVPPIVVSGPDFVVSGAVPVGKVLGPGESAGFDVQFRPASAGPRAGTLEIGDRTYGLAGMGVDPTLPKPRLTITLPRAASAQQGTAGVEFDAAARIGGTGTMTLEFASGADSAVAFATGGRSVGFAVAPGDTAAHFGDQASVAFQTGTTAGTLTITVELGGLTDRQTVTIERAPIVLNDLKALRTGSGIEVQVSGFDNTRTAGEIVFTFFDGTGNSVAPGAIRIDAAADFARYFATSDRGGVFSVKAAFPVSGDASKIAAVAVQIANAVGSTQSARTAF
jgi:hypothetical protein